LFADPANRKDFPAVVVFPSLTVGDHFPGFQIYNDLITRSL